MANAWLSSGGCWTSGAAQDGLCGGLRTEQNRTELHACDIYEPAIRWAVENIQGVSFKLTPALPPLPYPDAYFDLIYGISVVTHLDEEFQNAWLRELRRITKPGAFVLLSVHGNYKAQGGLGPSEFAHFRSRGFVYKRASDLRSVEGLPDFYQVAFHSPEYIQREWSKHFQIIGYVKHGPMYTQELVVLRRSGTGLWQRWLNSRRFVQIQNPIGCFDNPRAGEHVHLDELLMAGWAFSPERESVDLDLYVDGQHIAACTTGLSRPDVADAFGDPGLTHSGFSVSLPLRNLGAGHHIAWISKRQEQFPICVVHFRKVTPPK